MPRRKPPAPAGAPDTSRAGPPAVRDPAPPGASPLSPRDERLATALATGSTRTAAAAYAGMGVRTAYDAARKPEVIERIAQVRLEVMTEALGRLTSLHCEAIETVAAIMRDKDVTPHTRVWAAQLVMDRTIVLTEHMDTRRELAELRAAMAEITREPQRR